jgi:hypothetical protein
VNPDVLLLQGYTAFPSSLTDLVGVDAPGATDDDADPMVHVGFEFVDDAFRRSVSNLAHSVKQMPRARAATSINPGVAIYSREPIRRSAGVAAAALGAQVGALVLYSASDLSARSARALCTDILARRRRAPSRPAYIVVACSGGGYEDMDKLRACGMIMLGPSDKPQSPDPGAQVFADSLWVSVELYRDYDLTRPAFGGSLRAPVHELVAHAPLVIDLHRRPRLGASEDAKSAALLMKFRGVLENCLAFHPDVRVIGGPHVIGRVSQSADAAAPEANFVMYTNHIPNGVIRRMPLPDASAAMQRKQIAVAWASGGVTVEALNGWWVLNVGTRRYVWGYMVSPPPQATTNRAPLLIHYAKEYRADSHPEYAQWLEPSASTRRVRRKPAAPLLRHFSANTDAALRVLLKSMGVSGAGRSGSGSTTILDSNLEHVRYSEALFGASARRLDCLKKSHDVWVRFTELNAALAAGRPELADRSGIDRDFETLWRPVFEYYNAVLITEPPVAVATLDSPPPSSAFIMFRSQSPGSGFVFDGARRLEDMCVGDVVQTSTFVFTTYSPAVQTIVLSKSSDMEVIFVVPPRLVRELLLLSRATQNMVSLHNLPCLFAREEVMIPPFAMHRVIGITDGYVAAPFSDAPNTTHSGTSGGGAALKKISMYMTDKLSSPDAKSVNFYRRFYVVEMMGFSRSRIAAFDRAFGTDFTKLYAERTLVR